MTSPPIDILFHDHHVVVVNKPARIGVGSDDSGDESLLARVRAWNASRQESGRKGYCVPIHFLDRPVSGVVIFALSSKAAARLNESFRGRKVEKIYAAVVEGEPAVSRGTLEHWLIKDKTSNISHIASASTPDAKKCLLSYEVLATENGLSLLVVKPVTGRSHQIRVQLAAMGTPIWGDVKYGAKGAWEGQIALHAWKLTISHPVSKEAMTWQASPPANWDVLPASFKAKLS